MKHLLYLLIACGTLCCTKENAGNIADNDTIIANVAYGTDAQQKMDVYLPSGRSTSQTKVLIMIHGGGWASGDKTDYNALLPLIKQKLPGYAIINLDYRLYTNSTNLFPTQENDIQSAISFIYNKRNEYAISGKFVLIGASAGGHLALLQGYKHPTPIAPKAIVSFFGPTELTSLYNSNTYIGNILLVPVLGGTPTAKADLYYQSSPLNFVTQQSPPTIILQGGTDPLVPKSQADLLQAKLNSVNIANQLVYYPNNGHGWGDPDMTDSFIKIAAFLDKYVQ